MKKTIISLLCLSFLVFMLGGCSPSGQGQDTEPSQELEPHTIAVLVYDRSDDEVQSFRNYLENYIGPIFNTKFLYSDSILSEEEGIQFIKDAAEYGAEGVMSFNSYDLKKEADLCAEKGMYLMMASGTVPEKSFEAVADNEYFLGVVGPGKDIEYQSGVEMAQHFIASKAGNEYFILSGGGCLGNEMHKLRTMGIVDTLEKEYGVTLDKTSEEIALSEGTLKLEKGDLKICVAPGYFALGDYQEQAEKLYQENPYGIVMSVLPAVRFQDTIKGARLGVVDCYSENNLLQFTNGTMDFVTGKYSSIIGPSFAAMYNAVTGHADAMRENGKAFRITQGFWSSEDAEDYETKYALASSIEINAYNYDDLQNVICVFNPEASIHDLRELAEAYKFSDAVARRVQ